MIKKILIVLCVFVFLIGAGVFLYPSFRTAAQKQTAQAEIQRFENAIQEQNEQAEAGAEEERIYPDLWEACCAYNRNLYLTKQRNWTEENQKNPALNPADFDYTGSCFAYLSIPEIGMEYPIFLGANRENLNQGAAHLGQTSLPIGGENTHCVIAGHRSWSGAVMFRGLEELTEGSTIYITNPWETLTYTVRSVRTAGPKKSDELTIQEGRDLLTIFTCSYPNTRRLIVTCERSDPLD